MSLPHWKYHGHIYPKVRINGRAVNVHLLVAEKALGKPLPKGAQIHHVDENPKNFTNGNLVICQDMAYHRLLHMRARVVKAGGNPNTELFCHGCQKPLPIAAFGVNRSKENGLMSRCRACHCAYQAARIIGKRTAA